jgi:hypothetical protein
MVLIEGHQTEGGQEPSMPDVELNSTALTIAIQRELSELVKIFKANRDDERVRIIQARVTALAVARMNLKGP